MKCEQLLDLQSQKTLLNAINSKLKQQNQYLQAEIRLQKSENKKSYHKTPYKTTMAVGFSVIALFAFAQYLENVQFDANTNSQYKTRYVIDNLRGDTIDTWMHWNLVDGEQLAINIVNSDEVSKEAIDAITDAIVSDEIMQIDDSLLHKGPQGTSSTYYKGWSGALKEAAKNPTKFHIPMEFVMLESAKGEGNITIHLLTEKDSDGYSGYTKSITESNQILKSTITIYDVDSLSAEQISTIVRHEFGHALGLAHSTAPEDLMAPLISTQYPFISECNIDAIVALYDGNENGQVTCEK